MAVQIPTFADLPQVTPQGPAQQPAFAPNDPGAQGEAALGAGVQKAGGTIEDVAAYSQMAANRVNRALATADLDGNLVRTKEAIASETDPAKLDALRAQLSDHLDNAAQNLTDPGARKLWSAQQMPKIAEAQARVDLQQRKVYNDKFLAGADTQLNEQLRNAQQATDPADRETAQHNIGQIVGSLTAAGVVSETDGEKLIKGYGEKIITGTTHWMDANDNPQGALDYLKQNSQHVDPQTLDELVAHLQTKGDQAVALGLVNQALGRSPAAVSGSLPDRIIGAESGGNATAKNPLSSASGAGQFLDSTWLSMVKSNAPDVAAGKSDAQILALKSDPALARQMTAAYAQQNAAQLGSQGLPTDDGALYLAHFLGVGGAAKVIQADPTTPIDQIVGPQVMQANPQLAGKTAGDIRQLTAARIGASLPETAVPLTRGQQTLATLPDYLTARATIMAAPGVSDHQRQLALNNLTSQFHQETALYNALDTNAKRDLSDRQTANGADLLSRGIKGEILDPTQLSDWVRTQQITPEALRAYQTEITRQGKGADDLTTFNDLDRRARSGEDISQDIQQAVELGKLRGVTALQLQRAADARTQRQGDQVEKANFSTLRTIAGMDAQEHPMVDLGREAQQAQVALWAQAQQEWNQRVLIGKEDSSAVLADMKDRYSHPVSDVNALPMPRMGAIAKPEDVAAVAQKTQEAHDAGSLNEQQFRDEQGLIVKYKQILDAQQQRKDAAAAAKGGAGNSAARGRVEMK